MEALVRCPRCQSLVRPVALDGSESGLCIGCDTVDMQRAITKARARKAAVLGAVDAATPAALKDRIDAAILRLARTGRPFSANDCRDMFPEVKSSVIGGRFNALGNSGVIRKTGDRVPSTLASTNGHEIHVWVGRAA